MGKLKDLLNMGSKPRCSAHCVKCRKRCPFDRGHSGLHYCTKHGNY